MRKLLIILFISSFYLSNAQVKIGADGSMQPTGNYPATNMKYTRAYALSVVDSVARNNIPLNYRDTGMLVFVRADTALYTLVGGLTNIYWQKYKVVGGGGGGCPFTYYTTPDSLFLVKDSCGIIVDSIQWVGAGDYVIDTAFFDARYLPNGLITPGYVAWSGSGLTFNVTPAVYAIAGRRYTSSAGSITLATADPSLPRYDVIAVNNSGAIVDIVGTPGTNPSIPQIDPATQVLLTTVFIDAGATVPTQIAQQILYDENTENYTGVASGVTANFTNTSTVKHGSKSADIGSWTAGNTITFTKNTGTDAASSFLLLNGYINLKSAMPNTANIKISFLNGTTVVSNSVTLNTSYGLTKTIVGSYQTISIPLSAFSFTSNNFNKVRITLTGASGGFYLDYFQLQSGIVNGVNNAVLLQTNSVDNGSQSKLNLVAGTGVTLADNGSGNVTINSSGGGGTFNFDSALALKTTDNLNEGSTNKYFHASDTTALHGQIVNLTSQQAVNTTNIATNTTNIASKLNTTDTSIINAEIVQLRSAQALKLNISDTTGKWIGIGWLPTLAAKQNALTLTTTGTSGASTLTGAILNIPNYAGGGSSGTIVTEQMNFYNGEYYAGEDINTSTGAFSASSNAITDYIPITGSTSVTISVPPYYLAVTIYGWTYDSSFTAISEIRSNTLIATTLRSYTFTTPSNARFMAIYVKYGGFDFAKALQIKSTNKVTYTSPIVPESYSGTTSQKINNALLAQRFLPSSDVELKGIYTIDSTIILNSGNTIVFNNAHVILDSGSHTNIIRNASIADKAHIFNTANYNIKVQGIGNSTIEGSKENWGTDSPTGVGGQYWRSIGFYFANVENFIIKDIMLKNTNSWAMSLEQSRYGLLHNITIQQDSSHPNQDGINLRTATNNINISDCRFITRDDAIAMTNLKNGSDTFQILGTSKIYQPYKPDRDIFDILIKNIQRDSTQAFTSETPNQYQSGILILPEDSNKVHNITIDGMTNIQQILIAPIFFQYWVTNPATINDVYEIHTRNTGKAWVYLGTAIKNSSFEDLTPYAPNGSANCQLVNGSKSITRQYGNGQSIYYDSVCATCVNSFTTNSNGNYVLNGNIGIRNSTPVYPLDVTGKSRFSDTLNAALIKMDSTVAVGLTKMTWSNLTPAGSGGSVSAGLWQINTNGYNQTGSVSQSVKSRINFQGFQNTTASIFREFQDSTAGLGGWKQNAIFTSDGKVGLGTRTVGTLPVNYVDGVYNVPGNVVVSFQNTNTGNTSGLTVQSKNDAGGTIGMTAESSMFVAGFAGVGALLGGGGMTKLLIGMPSGTIDLSTGSLGSYPVAGVSITNNKVGIGTTANSSSNLYVLQGGLTVAPIIMANSGSILTTPLSGAFERDNTDFYLTNTIARYKVIKGAYGSFSGSATATTTFTVTIGITMPSTAYKVIVTPTTSIAAAPYYVNNKTTTTFDVVYLTGLTGTETFDWQVNQ